jgi:hypothetical protein
MKKLPGVEDVHVSLEKAFTEIWLRDGNTVTLAQLRDVIKSGGFKPGEAQIRAIGRLIDGKAGLAVDLAPSKAVLELEAESEHPERLRDARRHLGALVEISGRISQGERLVVKSISPRSSEPGKPAQ